MYRRFLNNDDYLGIITPEALAQLTRGNDARFIQAEESAEMSIVEYLSENYEIEKELAKGKYIAEYDRRITYPVGVHVYFEGQIHEVIRSVSGYRKPATAIYWEECSDIHVDAGQVVNYSQFNTYYPGDKVNYNGVVYICLAENGYKFDDIRIPMVGGWIETEVTLWQPVEYPLWSVVEYERAFYTLMTLDCFDCNLDPMVSDCWGAIADYDSSYNAYELSEHEYVVYDGRVFYPDILHHIVHKVLVAYGFEKPFDCKTMPSHILSWQQSVLRSSLHHNTQLLNASIYYQTSFSHIHN